jgi:hypothetical protein
VANPDFKAAARRHHKDAQFLLDDKRWPNADHLAGVAAECGLKAILLGWFGVTLNARSIPVWGSKKLGHVDELWNEVARIISGRSAPIFAALMVGSPFANWHVSDRYSDGNATIEQDAIDHLDMAKKIIGMLELATLDGFVS